LHDSGTPLAPLMSLSFETAVAPQAQRLFAGYMPIPGVYDEFQEPSGAIRPHWQKFAASLEALGPVELARCREQAKRLLHENGITYNAYGEPGSDEREWELDAVPLLFPAEDWKRLSTALVQRARLFNAILVDLYGPQKLLYDGQLPAEFVYAHPGFLRCCHGSRVPNNCYLHIYAAHIARGPDGRWLALADRTQSPSGAGYAVENRLVISRMLPGIFHDSQVERLASFFMTLRQTLPTLAAQHRDNPRLVLLTPGPRSPNYFEDAYLARYLGYMLVEGGDLTVRDNSVFLKTLGGLLPVDVILRRVPDDQCDPLELRGDALQGVPGLVQAARSNKVVIANALGSGLLEAAALLPFLEGLCRTVLGEELLLPSVATWWCGRDDDLRYVLANLDRLVIKPAFPRADMRPVFGEQLSSAQREHLTAAIRAHPREFVGQEQVARSRAPVWNCGEMQPWQVAMRTFLVASSDGYQVMPGGLTRVSASAEMLGDSLTAGQGSKDVWVLSEGPVTPVSLLRPPGAEIELRRSGNDLPSRVADNLFWLGRQVERTEGAVRLARSIVARLASEAEPGGIPELPVLLRTLADQGQISPAALVGNADGQTAKTDGEILAFLFDEQRSDGLRKMLTSVHQVASIVRDRISIDSWRILNHVDQEVVSLAQRRPLESVRLSEVLLMLNQMVLHLAAFAGLGMESMTRGPGWRFLDMGRRMERALHTMSLLRSTLTTLSDEPNPVLEALLEIADSSMTYRSRYLTTLQLAPVLDLLLTDESNPRSVAFQLVALAEHVAHLPRDLSRPMRSPEQRIMLATLTALQLADIHGLCQPDKDGTRKPVDRFLMRLSTQLRHLSESISHTYLIHAAPSRQLGEIRPPRAR
jgi:uncharacterized circularly permuted ATP-grasp superfamily protein/uncharacterized alpha-E superfamily protein